MSLSRERSESLNLESNAKWNVMEEMEVWVIETRRAFDWIRNIEDIAL